MSYLPFTLSVWVELQVQQVKREPMFIKGQLHAVCFT